MVPCGLFDKIHGHSWSDHEPTLIFNSDSHSDSLIFLLGIAIPIPIPILELQFCESTHELGQLPISEKTI